MIFLNVHKLGWFKIVAQPLKGETGMVICLTFIDFYPFQLDLVYFSKQRGINNLCFSYRGVWLGYTKSQWKIYPGGISINCFRGWAGLWWKIIDQNLNQISSIAALPLHPVKPRVGEIVIVWGGDLFSINNEPEDKHSGDNDHCSIKKTLFGIYSQVPTASRISGKSRISGQMLKTYRNCPEILDTLVGHLSNTIRGRISVLSYYIQILGDY